MEVFNGKIKKSIIVKDSKISSVIITNLLTEKIYPQSGEEFIVSYYNSRADANRLLFKKNPIVVKSSQFDVEDHGDSLVFVYKADDLLLTVTETFSKDDIVLKKVINFKSSKPIFMDYIASDSYAAPTEGLVWSRPLSRERVNIDQYIAGLGQPVYCGDTFTALASPVGDNSIINGITTLRYYSGVTLSAWTLPETVYGAAQAADMHTVQSAFFDYVYSFARKRDFYITFNSWYDYMLDINSDIIKKSFTEIYENFKASGLRPINCYVIDDGWTDYQAKKLWSVDKERFPAEFADESVLTKKFDSHFGLWLGPRGGYTAETPRYAKRLKAIGYGYCMASHDICTGHTRYIEDVGERLLYFMRENNVEYFKLDGFACEACFDKKHGHPVGGPHGLYFYTYLWEQWTGIFKRMKAQNPDIFINLTSYAHCSPFFLQSVSAIWMNNAADMGYIGEGSDLDKVLNYRDGRYYDLQHNRQFQLPSQYIYNHEPNYGMRNYNPPLPARNHRTVRYTDIDFEKYLYGCMMRGSGFIELYYSPELMAEGKKYEINAKVLKWAEDNFDVIANSVYFGGLPVDGEVYGYVGTDGDRAIIYVRNPAEKPQKIVFKPDVYTFRGGKYTVKEYFPASSEGSTYKGDFEIELDGKEIKIFDLKYDSDK